MSLNISKATMYDGGMYTCVVENSLGNLNRSFQLIIQGRSLDRPVFISKSTNLTRYTGDNVTLECLFYSDTSPFVQWFVQRTNKQNDLEFLKVNQSFSPPRLSLPSIRNKNFLNHHHHHPICIVFEWIKI